MPFHLKFQHGLLVSDSLWREMILRELFCRIIELVLLVIMFLLFACLFPVTLWYMISRLFAFAIVKSKSIV